MQWHVYKKLKKDRDFFCNLFAFLSGNFGISLSRAPLGNPWFDFAVGIVLAWLSRRGILCLLITFEFLPRQVMAAMER